MPAMLDRYPRHKFIMGRIARIFPMLLVAVSVAAAIQYFGGNKTTLDLSDVVATATLTNYFFGKQLSLGVVWTLIVEFEFYLLLSILGPLTQGKIFFTSFGIISLTLFSLFAWHIPAKALIDLSYLLLMLAGSSLFVASRKFIDSPKIVFIAPPVLIILAFLLDRHLITGMLGLRLPQDINPATLLISGSLFGIFLYAGNAVSGQRWIC